MPAFATALQAEIRRLARKEVKALTAVTRRAAVQHRRDIAALKRELRRLAKVAAVLESSERRRAAELPVPAAEVEKTRFSPSWIKTRRGRLKLSAANYGKLIGVSALTVYQWEAGKTRPRPATLARLAAMKHVGRREALRRLEMMNGRGRHRPNRSPKSTKS